MTNEEANLYDKILKKLATKSDRIVFSKEIITSIPHMKVKAVLIALQNEGHVKIHSETANDPISGVSLLCQITPIGYSFLEAGGYVDKFESIEKEKRRLEKIESKKNFNDNLRTWATVGSFLIAELALYNSINATKTSNSNKDAVDKQKQRLDDLIKHGGVTVPPPSGHAPGSDTTDIDTTPSTRVGTGGRPPTE